MEKLAALIIDIAGQTDIDLRTDYSGRGMFGSTCVGLSGSRDEIDSVLGEVVKAMGDGLQNGDWQLGEFKQAAELIFANEQDSMGRDMIVYWRQLQAPEQEPVLVTLQNLNQVSREDWIEALDGDEALLDRMLAAELSGEELTVVCCSIDHGRAEDNYYTVEFDDGTEIESIGGIHLSGVEEFA